MYETEEIKERVILVAVENGDAGIMSIDSCLDELAELVKTSGGAEAGRLQQKREAAHPKHYLGKGKIDELKDLISLTNATGIVCDDELSGVQLKNMEQMLDTKIMDRTMVILDIFAGRANTMEGKVQVELAQLKYTLGHLAGIGKNMSRLGGGIGTRGPGEKKLETDRRHIRSRIDDLNRELKEIKTHRDVLREKRRKAGIPVVSMVGYTNAGKSTMMNALTDAGVFAEDKLFATLDTTTRKITLPGGSDVLFTDTVGFIQKLPHHLVKAFRATLEELKYADILVHMVDAANATREAQMGVVYQTIKELDCFDKPIITVFTKMDEEVELPLPSDSYAKRTVKTSALNQTGMEDFTQAIEEVLKSFRHKMCVLIPYANGHDLNLIYGGCEIMLEEHQEAGTYLEIYADEEMAGRLGQYRVQ